MQFGGDPAAHLLGQVEVATRRLAQGVAQLEALRRGARGYVTKGAATDELVDAVRAIHAGQAYVSTDIANHVSPHPSGLRQLSEREREVFVLLARGVVPKQVAVDLGQR